MSYPRPYIGVTCRGKKYPAVQAAFKAEKLPMSQLQKTRKALREKGKATVGKVRLTRRKG